MDFLYQIEIDSASKTYNKVRVIGNTPSVAIVTIRVNACKIKVCFDVNVIKLRF